MLTSTIFAPARDAAKGRDAAGWTMPDVPSTNMTWQDRLIAAALSRTSGSRASPNQTMCGRKESRSSDRPGKARKGGRPDLLDGPFLRAAELPDVAVQLDDVAGARLGVEAVDVLGDDREFPEQPFPAGQDLVAGVGPDGSDDPAPPVVPFPNEPRIAGERFGVASDSARYCFQSPSWPLNVGTPTPRRCPRP